MHTEKETEESKSSTTPIEKLGDPPVIQTKPAVQDNTATRQNWGPVTLAGPKTWIDNQSSYTIYYKPEEGSGSIAVPPGGKGTAPFDGIAAPHLRANQVIKVVTGMTITVTNDDYDTEGSWKQWFGQGMTGGWMDSSWLWNITATEKKVVESGAFNAKTYTIPLTPDHGWLALFRSAGLNTSRYEAPHSITEYTNNLNGPK